MDDLIESITLSDIFMSIAIMFGVTIVLWLIVAAMNKAKDHSIENSPLRESEAKVVEVQRVPVGFAQDTWVVFELTSGSRVRLQDKNQTYLVVGDQGHLRWRGDRVDSFRRN